MSEGGRTIKDRVREEKEGNEVVSKVKIRAIHHRKVSTKKKLQKNYAELKMLTCLQSFPARASTSLGVRWLSAVGWPSRPR